MKLTECQFDGVIEYLLETTNIINLSNLRVQKYHPADLKAMIQNDQQQDYLDTNMYSAYSLESDNKLTTSQILFLKKFKPVCFDARRQCNCKVQFKLLLV